MVGYVLAFKNLEFRTMAGFAQQLTELSKIKPYAEYYITKLIYFTTQVRDP